MTAPGSFAHSPASGDDRKLHDAQSTPAEKRLFPKPDPRPKHVWYGDDEGHNCADCPEGSIWRCDRPAHPVPPLPNMKASVDMGRRLADHARARRTTPIPNRSLP